MPGRTLATAAVLAAAVAVYALVRRDRGRWRRQVAAQRLMTGCTERDNAALRQLLEDFRLRLVEAEEQDRVAAAAGAGLTDRPSRIDPHTEGGPQ